MADDDAAELQDRIFDLVKRSQDTMLDAGRTFTERVKELSPADTGRLQDLIDQAFDMTERILESQREFAKNVVTTVVAQLPAGGADEADRGS